MSGCPMPEKTSRAQTKEEAPPQPEAYRAPPIPQMKAENYALTDNETTLILKSNLRPDQYEDPNILAFIQSYLLCRNAGQAGKEAGLAPHVGRTLRLKPEIHACIEALTQKAVMKYGFDASEIVERVKEISAMDPIEFENPDGSFKTHLSLISPESRRAIKKFKVKNLYGLDANGMRQVIGQLVEVELWDKLKAVELLGREKNIFKETKKIEHDVTANMASVLLESRKKAELRERTRIEIEAPRDVIEIEGKVDGQE